MRTLSGKTLLWVVWCAWVFSFALTIFLAVTGSGWTTIVLRSVLLVLWAWLNLTYIRRAAARIDNKHG